MLGIESEVHSFLGAQTNAHFSAIGTKQSPAKETLGERNRGQGRLAEDSPGTVACRVATVAAAGEEVMEATGESCAASCLRAGSAGRS